tara:strand:- start:117 stop:479 length:363 start_codon:yes stop_codon:yes gene_type:complete
MHPKGANKNNDDQAIFSKDGPNLIKPALTNKPRVIPNKYRLKNNSNNGRPNFKIETPNNGEVKMIAGTNPINVLINAVKINAIIISFILRGAMNRFVKFLLQTSSKKSMLKLMLDLKRIS